MPTHPTIEIDGTESTFADLGLCDPVLTVVNMAVGEFTFNRASAFDASEDELFPYGAEIKVRLNREKLAGGGFGGGTKVFTGTRITRSADADGREEQADYVFANVWHRLERLTYGQKWAAWVRQMPLLPVVYTRAYYDTSEVNLFTRANPLDNTAARITNGAQVRDAVQWAIEKGVNLQLGTFSPALYLPIDFKTDLKVAEVIRAALKLCPDAVCYIDESTEPPTFHCIQRAQMTGVTLALSDELITRLNLTRRDDLVPGSVVLRYRRVDEVDGESKYLPPLIDAAPANATGFEDNAVCQTIQLEGARLTNVYGEIVSEEIPDSGDGLAPSDPQWWIAHGKEWLAGDDVADVTITPAERTGELPYALLPESGGIAPWMRDDDDNPAEAESETFTAKVKYTDAKYEQEMPEQTITVRLRTTNLASGTYSARRSMEAGEVAVIGLAQLLYDALQTPHWDGAVTITEQDCSADIGIHNTLNITGGTGKFATMGACVQKITYDLAGGVRTLTLGWPHHLSIDDLVEMHRFNRVRRVWNNPDMQTTGEPGGDGSDVELPDSGPMEDASDGNPHFAKKVVKGAENGQAVIKVDGTTGELDIRPKPADATKAAAPDLTGSITAALADTGGKEIKLREIEFTVKNAGGQCVKRKLVMLASDFYE